MSEFIGSRISLISKSDIKYIGTLHEINSDSHTVALESVTSYGTEGRKGDPSAEIPGSDQVYEYIVFRGSDVKELTIVSPPNAAGENKPPQVPNDPAILGSARPAPQNQQPPQHYNGPPPNQQYGYLPNAFQNQSRFQAPGGAHGFPGSPGAVPGYGGMGFHPPPPPGYGMGYPPPPQGQNFGPSSGPFPPQSQMPPGPPGQQMNQRPQPPQNSSPQVPGGSKPRTSLPSDAPAPTPPSQPLQKPIEMSGTPVPNSAAGPPPPLETKPTFASAASNASKSATKVANRVAVPLAPQKAAGVRQTAAPEDATQAATAAVAAAMAKLGNVDAGKSQPSAQTQSDNLTRQVNQMRLQDGQARGRGAPRGGRGAPRGGRREAGPKVEVPKEDYDFESANAKFNKQDVGKTAVGSGSPAPDNSVDASVTNGHDEVEDVVIPPKPSVERGYDKKSSFFDNISSDLKDRMDQGSEGVDGRTLRREERTRNVETFGQGSVDGSHRGYRGRGRGGFGRGGRGHRGGFDSRGGFRGRGRGGSETTAA